MPLRRPLFILLALGAIEGLAYWWMHPAPAGLGEPVLAYRPQVGRDPARSAHLSPAARNADGEPEIRDQRSGVRSQEEDSAQASSSNPKSAINNLSRQSAAATDHQSSISPSSTTHTLLPELVSRSIPSLRCSTGTAARIDRADGITVHVAFFEWDLAASNNVLEAFKHLPEECMGAIGMELVKIHPPRRFEVRGLGSGDRGQRSEVRRQKEAHAHSTSSTDHRSLLTDHSLLFDHTEFRDPTGKPIHAFKGVWVSGAANLLGDGFRGGADQSRQIRWRAALKRFRPAHARTAQGAIRGIANPDRAWKIFQESMLRDLTFER